ncbi:hypothetical protein [Aristaeella lactis]|uniref:Uncharacterized protein n=1 Tax=Aristaeella lactis TaxID=3046383 RepID=A0AC61PL37_9FIRM|nr:hypothetical protein [Aristaeella lactis]QUA52174.1 hypothetical protein JYE50_10655 [Aristaeella lactis]SMC58411.1 hypothetical protein SAMN06297397_1552 [Aristaeella lactis]
MIWQMTIKDLLVLFFPGYIVIQACQFIRKSSVRNDANIDTGIGREILLSILISAAIKYIVDSWIRPALPKNWQEENQIIIISFGVAILFVLLVYFSSKSKRIMKIIVDFFGISPSANIWNYMLEEGAYVEFQTERKGKKVFVRGQIEAYQVDDDGDCRLVLRDYIIRDYNMHKDVILPADADRDAFFVVCSKDLSHIEVRKDKAYDSKKKRKKLNKLVSQQDKLEKRKAKYDSEKKSIDDSKQWKVIRFIRKIPIFIKELLFVKLWMGHGSASRQTELKKRKEKYDSKKKIIDDTKQWVVIRFIRKIPIFIKELLRVKPWLGRCGNKIKTEVKSEWYKNEVYKDMMQFAYRHCEENGVANKYNELSYEFSGNMINYNHVKYEDNDEKLTLVLSVENVIADGDKSRIFMKEKTEPYKIEITDDGKKILGLQE